jgi:ADP-ribose pyrophosphatase YjhB (NUDIX family)
VAIKALIVDDQERLLVVFNEDGEAEIPGGGWEHDESFEESLRREIAEELNAKIKNISPIQFVFPSTSDHGWRVVRIVVTAELDGAEFMSGDEMTGARFVTRDEFLGLDFDITDAPIQTYAQQIWG